MTSLNGVIRNLRIRDKLAFYVNVKTVFRVWLTIGPNDFFSRAPTPLLAIAVVTSRKKIFPLKCMFTELAF